MDENLKKKIKWLILFFVGLLLAILVFFLLSFFKKTPTDGDTSSAGNPNVIKPVQPATTTASVPVTSVIKKTVPVSTVKKITKNDVGKMAASFAERFGTYSNQANFSNMLDLKIFMSRNMQTWSDGYVAKQSKKNNDIYYGITTKAVTTEILDFNNESGQASVLVQTRRLEAMMTTGNTSRTFNQDILIKLIKENDAWKIDSAYWR
jgi:hypothetical protein